MLIRRLLPIAVLVAIATMLVVRATVLSQAGFTLEAGFRTPPQETRPWVYYLLLNGYVNRAHVETELRDYAAKGVGGLCIFDMGARGDKTGHPPAGPAFLSPESAADIAHVIRTAGKFGMQADLSVTSSWDMGSSWVKPEDASMTLLEAEMDVRGPARVDVSLPFPALPADTPRDADGKPLFARNVAVIAIPEPKRQRGHWFLFEAEKPFPTRLSRFVLANTKGGDAPDAFAKDFVVEVSNTNMEDTAFREVLRGTLQAREGDQEFRIAPIAARYIRLTLLNGHSPAIPHLQLAEFEAYTEDGRNVLISHRAARARDGGLLLAYSSARAQVGAWSAGNLQDGVKSGPRGSWSSAGAPPLVIDDPSRIRNLSASTTPEGRLQWDAPAGDWKILRYVVTNTGERLKVPSPNSDGLATDHFSEEATLRYIRDVTARLQRALGKLSQSALKELYLASYEVRGNVWTPRFLEEFEKRRGYALTPFLPALNGALVRDSESTARILFDFRKTQGELLVDAYYRAAARAAREAGLGIESEAGGPGPPIHNVPVDALLANSAVDSVRGEFWPYRPQADGLWVIKETAAAAHIYGKPLVAMEAFTSVRHWEEGPQDLKDSADRAFCEGMNHVVWHTAVHLPPEAGKPGWVYGAGTHLNTNVPWWPMAKPFLDYLARSSYLLRQGRFVADVLYYYGDGGFKFVPPKHQDPSLGFGYDYDVTNSEVLRDHTRVDNGRLLLDSGMRYEVLVLPESDAMDPDVLRKVEQLVQAGAWVVGPKPSRAHGYRDAAAQDAAVRELAGRLWGNLDGSTRRSRNVGKGRIYWGTPLRDVLRERNVQADLSVPPDSEAHVDFIHRSTPEAEIYFVRNKTNQPLRVDASFRVANRLPEAWDAITGDMRDLRSYRANGGRTDVALRFAPMGSTFVVFRKTAPAGGETEPAAAPGASQESIPLAGPWTVRFADGPGAPAQITLPELQPLSAHNDPGVRHFAGIAEYESTFALPNGRANSGVPLLLELGDFWAVAEVRVNGENCGVVWAQPFAVDVTKALRDGPNRITIRVATNWINRLIGDALQPDASRRVTRTNIVTNTPQGIPWKDYPLRKSGLFGPVRLVSRASE